jgi:hypothetical protein
MTTSHEMEMAYITQQQVIAALYEIGDPDLADRLECCVTAANNATMATVGHIHAEPPVASGADAR